MRSWTVDADDIKIAEDFDDALLHKPPWLEGFLGAGGDDKFIVIGTKGFGKTLLLKAKRVRYPGDRRRPLHSREQPARQADRRQDLQQGHARALRALDRVVGEGVADLDRGRGAEAARPARRPARQRRGWTRCSRTRSLRGVIDHFVNLLDLPRNELHRCATDTDNALVPRLRALKTPVAIFIDNVDEYFNKHVRRAVGRASDTGELSPSIWYFAQMGLVEVAYQLRRVNHHLKVFAAVRKEAFLQVRRDDVDGAAVPRQRHRHPLHARRACARSSSTTSAARRNATSCAPELLRADPMRRRSSARRTIPQSVHARGGGRLRLHRAPHAAAAARLHDHRPEAVRPAAAGAPRARALSRRSSTSGATEIATEYLNEIAPYLGDVDLARVLALIPSNVLTRDDGRGHLPASTTPRPGRPTEMAHIFCMLYRAGLLGHLDTRPRDRQAHAALPAARRGDLPARRHPAGVVALPRAPGAGRRDRAAQPATTRSASTA